jgi:hypothetical protein
VHVPDIVPYRTDPLGRRLLQVEDLFVGLVLQVSADRVLSTLGGTNSDFDSRPGDNSPRQKAACG